ncbi:MAG: 2-amino-4-hydroxy-6-hydroxymethyldihydropteridine diphosphokinase [Deltaproteobacteria bacterium]|nr:2-amino-4-hydroxy-6-hydroxymethyldihydropteridine diphosphokinase [Deltaproteobacteria bacterium]
MNCRVFLALGSNLGDRAGHLRAGVSRLVRDGTVRVDAASSLWASEPVGFEGGEFLNAVVAGRTVLAPALLLERAKAAERAEGRAGSGRGSRTLDIDLLYYEDRVVREAGLEVPHPRRLERSFVLVPLGEVCGDATDPVTGRAVGDEVAARIGAVGPAVRRVEGPEWWKA